MKVLQINNVYDFGSTGKITRDIHRTLLEEGVESLVYYGRRKRTRDKNVTKICSEIYGKANNLLSRVTGIPYGGCYLSTNKLIRKIRKEKPDVVHLQCINGFFVNIYRLIEFLKREQVPTILTLHAEFMYTANCGHAFDCEKWKTGCGACKRLQAATGSWGVDRTACSQKKMRRAFQGFNKLTVIGVSEWVMKRARESKMFKDAESIVCVHNGIDLECFDYRQQLQDVKVAEKYGLSRGKKIVMHVTPSLQSPYKGGEFFLQFAREIEDDYQCVIVGSNPFAEEVNIRCIPYVTDQTELASLYRIADVLVITSTADNFPTVCLEAQACGTPVVGFDVGGVKETVWPGMGECVEKADMIQLRQKAKWWAEQKKHIPRAVIEESRAYINKERMVRDYVNLYARQSKHGSI